MQINIKDIKKGDRFWNNKDQYEAIEDATFRTVPADFKITGQHSFIFHNIRSQRLTKTPVEINFSVAEGKEVNGPVLTTEKS